MAFDATHVVELALTAGGFMGLKLLVGGLPGSVECPCDASANQRINGMEGQWRTNGAVDDTAASDATH
ncbi:hypothetical protein NPX13_g1657 [Xylaria arbuscula]|uniref:Uncharacterized protein n=1 Tax=Xylaria arbuscula TaxID=114810 RepID=A0A9W8NLN5_9PEZI|nr:hypothetical protein NPX13_g1657 [Xylaria arbuscula]